VGRRGSSTASVALELLRWKGSKEKTEGARNLASWPAGRHAERRRSVLAKEKRSLAEMSNSVRHWPGSENPGESGEENLTNIIFKQRLGPTRKKKGNRELSNHALALYH